MSRVQRMIMLLLALVLGIACASPIILAKQQIVLEWTTWQVLEQAEKEMMEGFIAGFKKQNPNVEIKLTGNAWAEYFDKLQVRMAGGSCPDIFACSMDNFARYQGLGFAVPLESYINMAKYKGKFINVADITVINDKTYGICYLTLPFTMIYNKDLFAKYGLKPPTTPEQLIEVGKKLTIANEQFGYSGSVDPSVPADFYTELLVWTVGYNGKFARKGVPTINEPQNVEAITMLKKAYDAGIMPKGIDRQVYRKMQLSGRIGMLVDGAYYFDWVRQESEEAYKQLDAAPPFFPNKAGRTYTVYQCVSKGGKNKQIAAEFLDYILRPENQEQFIPRVKQTPAIRDVKVPEQWLKENPWFKAFLEMNPVSVVPEGIEIYTEDLKKILARYVGEVFLHDKPVKQALDESQQAMMDLLKSRGYKLPTTK